MAYVLVCGGRDYADVETLKRTLDKVLASHPDMHILHGAATGADSLAEDWAKQREIPYTGIPAKWQTQRKAAGPIRNREMLKFNPIGVVAFPGGTGTADMVKAAQEVGIRVWQVTTPPPREP